MVRLFQTLGSKPKEEAIGYDQKRAKERFEFCKTVRRINEKAIHVKNV